MVLYPKYFSIYFLTLSSQISFKIPRTNTEEGPQWPAIGSPEQGTTVHSWEKPSPICSPFSSEATTPPPLLEGQHSRRRHNRKREEWAIQPQEKRGRGETFMMAFRKSNTPGSGGWRTLKVALYFKQQWERRKASC